MNRVDFLAEVQHFAENARELAPNRAGATQAGLLLVDLLATRAQWAPAAVVDIFAGKHGDALARYATQALRHGCATWATPRRHGVTRAPKPFAFWCGKYGRIDTLRAVVAMSLELREDELAHKAATKAGRQLDRLSTLCGASPVSEHITVSFLRMVEDKEETWGPETVRAALELVVDIDPNHGYIAQRAGTRFGALITEATMRAHIRKTTGVDGTPTATQAADHDQQHHRQGEAPRRRSLGL